MGTRCMTLVKDEDGKGDVLCLYRQFDGYVEGHGKDLVSFLKGLTLVNGLGPERCRAGEGESYEVANGMGCLAAQIVAYFKGNFYRKGKATVVPVYGEELTWKKAREKVGITPGSFYVCARKGKAEGFVYTVYRTDLTPEQKKRQDTDRRLFCWAGNICIKIQDGRKVFYDGPVSECDTGKVAAEVSE